MTCDACEPPAPLPRPPSKRQKLQPSARSVSAPLPADQVRPALAASFGSSPTLAPSSRRSSADHARAPPPEPAPFRPYGSPRTIPEVNERILDSLRTLGARRDDPLGRGALYILAHPRDPRFLKIGYTAGLVAARVQDQRLACREPFPLVADARQRRFAGAKVVDDVLKQALHPHRHQLACAACSRAERSDGRARKHEEWYELRRDEALRTVELWRGWVQRCQPFDAAGRLSMFWRWRLRSLEARIDDVCWEDVLVAPSRWHWLWFVLSVIGWAVCWLWTRLPSVWPWESIGGRRFKTSKSRSMSKCGMHLTWLCGGLIWYCIQISFGWIGFGLVSFGALAASGSVVALITFDI